MDTPFPWIAIALGVTTIALLLVGVVVLHYARAQVPPLTREERAELAASPMTVLEKIAWAGLLVGGVQSAAIGVVFATQGGAATYWEDDRMRLQVVGIFLVGLLISAVLYSLAHVKADERERAILSWGPRVQSVAVLIFFALGNVFLTHRFHDEGAIPVVYAYLSFGAIFIVYMTSNFLGILLGFRATRFHGQG